MFYQLIFWIYFCIFFNRSDFMHSVPVQHNCYLNRKIHTRSSDNFFSHLCPSGTECLALPTHHSTWSKVKNLLFSGLDPYLRKIIRIIGLKAKFMNKQNSFLVEIWGEAAQKMLFHCFAISTSIFKVKTAYAQS